ncbi:L-threonylcarbamoyladenylate synthase [Limnobacter humi]|uniref:Threonylcarbamoyl-AMP synthase n=1 Tax=Limnobacter humi TaxID=1778671 RepID=A0ABT1WH01_9BURK|nr:L-threonylcarbamoyladenylate synthase [Limnobacter humi]MCQ8896806.1 L-threonylcarbamoyladenylate synthase [Limnobacter humi]
MANRTTLLKPTHGNIEECAQALRLGKLVAFPTETVFGLGAAVSSLDGIRNIFAAKGRPENHPLIAHVAPHARLDGWVAEVTPTMQRLMDAFWPGPLTLVVPKGPNMPLEVTGGQHSVGIRCPSHPVAIELLKAVGVPVAAPSANRFGKVSPTRASHVLQELDGRIAYVLDGDIPAVGIESTIVSLLKPTPAILRPGAITAEQIEQVLGVAVQRHAEALQATDAPRVSGALEKHYSPDAKVLVLPASAMGEVACEQPTLIVGWGEAFLDEISEVQLRSRVKPMLLALAPHAEQVAQQLYLILRKADEDGYAQLIVEEPDPVPAWEGVADRLRRASA